MVVWGLGIHCLNEKFNPLVDLTHSWGAFENWTLSPSGTRLELPTFYKGPMAVVWELHGACCCSGFSCTWWSNQGCGAISQPLALTTISMLRKGGKEQSGQPSRICAPWCVKMGFCSGGLCSTVELCLPSVLGQTAEKSCLHLHQNRISHFLKHKAFFIHHLAVNSTAEKLWSNLLVYPLHTIRCCGWWSIRSLELILTFITNVTSGEKVLCISSHQHRPLKILSFSNNLNSPGSQNLQNQGSGKLWLATI